MFSRGFVIRPFSKAFSLCDLSSSPLKTALIYLPALLSFCPASSDPLTVGVVAYKQPKAVPGFSKLPLMNSPEYLVFHYLLKDGIISEKILSYIISGAK